MCAQFTTENGAVSNDSDLVEFEALHMIDHPVVWANCVGAGRGVYTAMGHTRESFRAREVLTLLENVLTRLMSGDDHCQSQLQP